MYDRVMTRETHAHSCRTGKNKVLFSFSFGVSAILIFTASVFLA